MSIFPSQRWWVRSWEHWQFFFFILLQPRRWWDTSRNLSALHTATVLLRNVHNRDVKIHLSSGVSSVSSKRYLHFVDCWKHWEIYLHTIRMNLNVQEIFGTWINKKFIELLSKCVRTLIVLERNDGKEQFLNILPLWPWLSLGLA